jgi:hypothetical protein
MKTAQKLPAEVVARLREIKDLKPLRNAYLKALRNLGWKNSVLAKAVQMTDAGVYMIIQSNTTCPLPDGYLLPRPESGLEIIKHNYKIVRTAPPLRNAYIRALVIAGWSIGDLEKVTSLDPFVIKGIAMAGRDVELPDYLIVPPGPKQVPLTTEVPECHVTPTGLSPEHLNLVRNGVQFVMDTAAGITRLTHIH